MIIYNLDVYFVVYIKTNTAYWYISKDVPMHRTYPKTETWKEYTYITDIFVSL